MGDNLLEIMKQTQKASKKRIKKKLNPNSAFATLTDDEIALVLAFRSKNLRMYHSMKQSDFSQSAHLSSLSTYSNFEQTGSVSLINFIKIVRNFGRLHELEKILQPSTAEIIETFESVGKSRVRKSNQ